MPEWDLGAPSNHSVKIAPLGRSASGAPLTSNVRRARGPSLNIKCLYSDPMPLLSNSEIDVIEQSLGVTLPGLYRKLLVESGFGAVSDHTQIYHPNEVRALYEPFFDQAGQLFAPYFPFGCDNDEQTLWIIDAEQERAATIWHETVPDDWPEEDWLAYEDWIRQNLSPGA